MGGIASSTLSMADIVKTTIWLTHADHFPVVNSIYTEYMADPAPARSTPVVIALPYPGALLSIEATAMRNS